VSYDQPDTTRAAIGEALDAGFRHGPDTDPVRHDLTAEAIRLTRVIRALMPDDGEVAGQRLTAETAYLRRRRDQLE
jgi:predicted RNA polymerase sigma factor